MLINGQDQQQSIISKNNNNLIVGGIGCSRPALLTSILMTAPPAP